MKRIIKANTLEELPPDVDGGTVVLSLDHGLRNSPWGRIGPTVVFDFEKRPLSPIICRFTLDGEEQFGTLGYEDEAGRRELIEVIMQQPEHLLPFILIKLTQQPEYKRPHHSKPIVH